MMWTVDEVINVAVSASQMAARVNGRFVLDHNKLQWIGLTPAQIRRVKERLPAHIKVERRTQRGEAK